jgi:PRTRC genetic system protein C
MSNAAITAITRKVIFKDKTLKDMPGMSASQMKTFYTQLYPELSTASFTEAVTTEGITVTFEVDYKAQG